LGAGLHRPTKTPRPHPNAPHRENDNSRTCESASGRQPGHHKRHKEAYLIGIWARQADYHSASSLPPLRKRQTAKTTTTARAWASLGTRSGAANTTRRGTPLGVGLLRPTSSQRHHSHLSESATMRKRHQPHVRGQDWASARMPQEPPGGVPHWALGSTSRPNLHVLASSRHDAKTTLAARAWARLGASPGDTDASRMCISVGAWLHKPTKPQSPHPHLATMRKRQQLHVRGQFWAPAQAPQTRPGGGAPRALGSTSGPNLKILTPTSPKAPQRENEDSSTCVGTTGRQIGRHKHHKEVSVLERGAPQADQT